MLESMTGFGRGEHTDNGITAVTELRSVNNRYLEITFRLPTTLQHLESAFKEIVQKQIERGKINLAIQVEADDEEVVELEVNPIKVRSYARLLREVSDHAGIEADISLDQILTFKEVFQPRELPDDHVDRLSDVAYLSLEKAVAELKEMRLREGEILLNDLTRRIDSLEQHFHAVGDLAESRSAEAKDKLKERVLQLISQEEIDSERMEMEIAILADKLDISEEMVRMQSHIDYFRENLKKEKSTGRKLNFLLQELHREANTIGSKANHADVAHHVVSIKELLENIREQIQNIV